MFSMLAKRMETTVTESRRIGWRPTLLFSGFLQSALATGRYG